jgi:Ca2+/H+ antiporter
LSWFIPLGATALIAGLTVMIAGLRRHREQHPKHVAMLIGGMMLTAFGLILAGFAIAYQTAAPLDLNSGAAK